MAMDTCFVEITSAESANTTVVLARGQHIHSQAHPNHDALSLLSRIKTNITLSLQTICFFR